MKKLVIVLASSAALAGCGGGGSSSGGASLMTQPATTTSSSNSSSNNTTSTSAGATIFGLQGGGTLTVNADGTATFAPPGVTAGLSPNLTNGQVAPPWAPSFSGGALLFRQVNGGSPNFVLERMGPATGLNVSDFGAWAQGSGSSGPLVPNFYAAGQPGTLTMPTSGTAIYNGQYIGHLGSGNLQGGIQLSADFGRMTMSSQFTSGGLTDRLGGVATGSISGSGYSTSFSQPFGNFYTLNGQFYGPNAAETTGSFAGEAGSAGARVSGVFGAKR